MPMPADRRSAARRGPFLGIMAVTAALVGSLSLVLPAGGAETAAVVVELFTSQGCAACRSAEAVAGELARRPSVLVLTLPVPYWDYLGWKDTLALPAFAERQRGYAAAHGEWPVFTPQAMVDGLTSANGSDRSAIETGLRTADAPIAPVSVSEKGDRLVVEVGASADPSARGEVFLVPVLRSRRIAIEHGETAGQSAHYVNVARGLHRLGSWKGTPVRFEVPRTAARAGFADAYAVLVQAMPGGRPGRILAFARGPGL